MIVVVWSSKVRLGKTNIQYIHLKIFWYFRCWQWRWLLLLFSFGRILDACVSKRCACALYTLCTVQCTWVRMSGSLRMSCLHIYTLFNSEQRNEQRKPYQKLSKSYKFKRVENARVSIHDILSYCQYWIALTTILLNEPSIFMKFWKGYILNIWSVFVISYYVMPGVIHFILLVSFIELFRWSVSPVCVCLRMYMNEDES